LTASGRKRREGAARRAVGAAVTRLAHLTDAVPADGRQGGGRRDGAGRGRCGRGGAADVRRAAAAGLREGARATVEGTAAAIGNHPAVRAHGGTCGGGAARAEKLLARLDAYPAAATLIGPTRLAVTYARAGACDTPPDDDERGGEHRHE